MVNVMPKRTIIVVVILPWGEVCVIQYRRPVSLYYRTACFVINFNPVREAGISAFTMNHRINDVIASGGPQVNDRIPIA